MNKMIRLMLIYLVFLGSAFNITYWAMAKYDVTTDFGAVNDARYYIQMSEGDYDLTQRRYAKRFVVPEMVRFLRGVLKVERFLDSYYEDIGRKLTQMYFGLVNIFFISLTAFFFYLFCCDLKFGDLESLFSGFIFLTSFFVITYYPVPLVDAGGCFFVMACVWAIKRKNLFWLCVSFLIGVFAKEAVFVVILIALLDDLPGLPKKALACLPGIILYFLISGHDPSSTGVNIFEILFSPNLLGRFVQEGIRDYSWFTAIETFQFLMFLWIFFFWGLVKCAKPEFIRKQLWLLVLPVVVPFLVGESSVNRVSFYLFPIFIPIVFLGIRDLLGFGSSKVGLPESL